MKYLYEEDREEVIRPRKTIAKKKPQKSNHKHEYVTEIINDDFFFTVKKMTCTSCGKVKQ